MDKGGRARITWRSREKLNSPAAARWSSAVAPRVEAARADGSELVAEPLPHQCEQVFGVGVGLDAIAADDVHPGLLDPKPRLIRQAL